MKGADDSPPDTKETGFRFQCNGKNVNVSHVYITNYVICDASKPIPQDKVKAWVIFNMLSFGSLHFFMTYFDQSATVKNVKMKSIELIRYY